MDEDQCPACGSSLVVVERDDLYVERDCVRDGCDYGEVRCASCGAPAIACYCR